MIAAPLALLRDSARRGATHRHRVVGSTIARHVAGLPEDETWLAEMIDTVWTGIAAR